MRYSETVKYVPADIGQQCLRLGAPRQWVPVPFESSPLWTRMHQQFDTENFLYSTPPAQVGRAALSQETLNGVKGLRVMRCPVKTEASPDMVLPLELEFLLPFVRHLAELERWVNPNFHRFHAHLTFECTEVAAGATQRVPGWHVDGFQGVRVPPHQIEHSYVWSSNEATEYCLQPFFVSHLNRGRHNLFDELITQARESNVYQGEAEHFYLLDPYVVHRAPKMRQSGLRAFFRLTFSPTALEDGNNTRNLTLDGEKRNAERLDVRDRLHAYTGGVPWEMYGVRKGEPDVAGEVMPCRSGMRRGQSQQTPVKF